MNNQKTQLNNGVKTLKHDQLGDIVKFSKYDILYHLKRRINNMKNSSSLILEVGTSDF